MKSILQNPGILLIPFIVGALVEYVFRPDNLFFDQRYSAIFGIPWLRILILGLATIVGIFCGLWADELRNQKKGSRTSASLLKQLWKKPTTVLALLVSPIVFHAVYVQVESYPDTVIALLLAYQNGFFWQSVIDTVKSSTANQK